MTSALLTASEIVFRWAGSMIDGQPTMTRAPRISSNVICLPG